MERIFVSDDDIFQDDPDFYLVDSLLHIDSYDKALEYVSRVLSYATTPHVEAIIKALYRVSGRQIDRRAREAPRVTSAKKTAGGMLSQNRMHPDPIYNFLSACDSVHDFCDPDNDSDAQIVLAALDVELPTEVPREIIRNEKAVCQILAKSRVLHFGDQALVNPMYGADIFETFDINSAFNNNPELTLEGLYEMLHRSLVGKLTSAHRPSSIPIDIVTAVRGRDNEEVLKLQQIAHLIGNMRFMYGAMRDFQIDCTDQHILLIICAIDHVSAAMLSRFSALAADNTISDIKPALKQMIIDENIALSWTVTLSDANLFDAAKNDVRLPHDERPTGPVFAPHANYQITLNGIRHGSTEVIIRDADKSEAQFTITNKEATKEFSTKSLRPLVEALTPATYANPMRNFLAARSRPLLYALKRAGDWGQIEHAKRYRKVFITCDKYAALYAWYRRVPFMFMRRQVDKIGFAARGIPAFVVYSFWGVSERGMFA